jgi:hypothetical protein
MDCKLADHTHNICAERSLAAVKYCQKYCGFCSGIVCIKFTFLVKVLENKNLRYREYLLKIDAMLEPLQFLKIIKINILSKAVYT